MMHGKIVGHYLCPLLAEVVARFDVVQVSVGKIQPLSAQVDGEAVRPKELRGYYGLTIGAVHVGSFDPRLSAPIAPEHETLIRTRVKHKSTRIRHIYLLIISNFCLDFMEYLNI